MTHPAEKMQVRVNIARFWSGADAEDIVKTVLIDLEPYVEFEISDLPQVLLYGPYPGEMPKGRYTKVFIGCENLRPMMGECDWAFGVLHEEQVKHPRYMRFMRWGDDSHLIQRNKDWRHILKCKTRFCAFVYANKIPYRESFFTALSRYKSIDAPGRSMNNMPSIDPVPGNADRNAKIEFLRGYKFVVAFENSSRSGYNTEKLTDAIEADCVPIYWGDPQIGRSFNVRRFINAHDYLPKPRCFIPKLPYAPHSIRSTGGPTLAGRLARRFNGTAGEIEQRAWAAAGFRALVDHIVEMDHDDEMYLQHLREPFLIDNRVPDRSLWIARWQEIFKQGREHHVSAREKSDWRRQTRRAK
jgi:alpha(1,3/1,4) fucosyltransferase